MKRTIVIGIILILILTLMIIVLPTLTMAQNEPDDSWDDTHWGGDVGEEEYEVPKQDEGTKGGGELCSMSVFCIVGVSVYCIQRKRKG